ncbi:hypothetical protein N7470_001779 [Penicillium chermesinum]|nr:hypothetical protein N7470_001779 [Penicillium chermesinum]
MFLPPSTGRDDAQYRAQVAGILGLGPLPWLVAETAPTQLSDPDAGESLAYRTEDVDRPNLDSASVNFSPEWAESHESHDAHAFVWPRPSLALIHQPLNPLSGGAIGASPVPGDSAHSVESLVSVVPDSQPGPDSESYQANARPRLPSQDADAPAAKRPRVDPKPPTGQPSQTVNAPEQVQLPANAPRSEEHGASGEAPEATTAVVTSSTIEHSGITASSRNQHETTNPCRLTNPLQSLSLPLEIRPPPPPISTGPFTTHITPTLSMLTERLKPQKTYKPLHQTRPLDALERGYWSLQINLVADTDPPHESTRAAPVEYGSGPARRELKKGRAWSADSFLRFWTFLTQFVGKDARAGWGVWCVLERDGASAPAPRSALPLLLKVYAWGETAMQVWLLLFLASERRVRDMGAQWKDSREEVVIQMP